MNYKYSLMIAFLFSSFGSFAQIDTTYKYYGKNWKECKKDTAFYIGKIFKEGNLWHSKDYQKSTGNLQSEGFYKDQEAKVQKTGTFIIYSDSAQMQYRVTKYSDEGKLLEAETYYHNGNLFEKISYNKNGKKNLSPEWFDDVKDDVFINITMDPNTKEEHHYFENGKEGGYVIFSDDGKIIEQKGWDENGKEIPDYIHKQSAAFPGGPEAWKKYLIKNLHADFPSRTPYGKYTVMLSFMISKEGQPTEVVALNDPGYGTAQEAIRVIKESGLWLPATVWGKKVIHRQRIQITFLVSN